MNNSIKAVKKTLETDSSSYKNSLNTPKNLVSSLEAVILAMALFCESSDANADEHIGRVKNYTELLGLRIRQQHPEFLSEESLKQIVLYSPLHDVGKITIPEKILKKTGAYTPAEFNTMKTHTTNAAQLLRKAGHLLSADSANESLKTAIEIAEYHHEKYDGSGYPHGLKGEKIPLSARIVAIADIYDAIRSSKPYKRPRSHMEAVNIILLGDEKTQPAQFDPIVLDAFEQVHLEFNKVYNDTLK